MKPVNNDCLIMRKEYMHFCEKRRIELIIN